MKASDDIHLLAENKKDEELKTWLPFKNKYINKYLTIYQCSAQDLFWFHWHVQQAALDAHPVSGYYSYTWSGNSYTVVIDRAWWNKIYCFIQDDVDDEKIII